MEGSQPMDEGGVGGPGAPTPLGALEVRLFLVVVKYMSEQILMFGMIRALLGLPSAIFNLLLMAALIRSRLLPILPVEYWNRSRESRSKKQRRY